MKIPKQKGLLLLIMLLIGCCFSSVAAQVNNKRVVSGKVSDLLSKEEIAYGVVMLPMLNIWAITDEQGEFTMKDVPQGEWQIEVSCLGYRKIDQMILVAENPAKYHFEMQLENLALKNVVVTAQQVTLANTTQIGRTAIQHLQITSLHDILQLLPGQLSSNPDLSQPGMLTIRETNTNQPNESNSLGTSLIIDGARISNDANLQRPSTAKTESNMSETGVVGVDTRKFSPDRIESINVIQGVASAEYGDLTSGAVLMTTKAGISPFEVSVKTDPRLKSIALGKGLGLGINKGFLNMDFDYTRAFRELLPVPYYYNRISSQLGYSNTFYVNHSTLSFNTKISGYITNSDSKNDPDKSLLESVQNKDNEFNLNMFGNWLFHKKWITGLRYNFFGSYGYQLYEENKEYKGANPIPVTYSPEDGEHLAAFSPINYTQKRNVEGKPVYLQGKITANASHKSGPWFNKAMIGAEWSSIGNNGRGKWGENMPLGYRDQSFSDIPFIHNYALFLEDKISLDLGISSVELQAGLRMANILTDALHYKTALDPRFNIKYTFIDNPASAGIRWLSLRGSWGIQHKMPTLMHLYPDPFYTDRLSFSYQNADFSEGVAIMTSKVVRDTSNPDLKLPKSTNSEIGLDWNIAGIKGSVVYYNEKLKNAFTLDPYITMFPYRVYDRTETMPEYTDGVLMAGGQPVPYSQDTIFSGYMRPGNRGRTDKWGIEYTVNLGKIPALHTSIIVDGAYMNIKRTKEGNVFEYKTGLFNQQNRKYAAIYSGAANSSNGSRSERLNTNLRLVTSIPRIRMVVTLGLQCVWIDRSQRLSETADGIRAIMRDKQGNRVEGNIYQDNEHKKYIYPVALIDFHGNQIPFTEEMLNNAQMKEYETESSPGMFLCD
ncbi:MAG: TonB-dependent receptor, partial [Bacteroidales bacterium]